MKNTLIILTPGFPKDEADTTCLPPQQIFVQALKENYPELDIVILSFQYPFEKTIYNWYGNTVTSFGGREKGGLSRRLLWYKVEHELKRIYSQKKITGILSFWCGECALIASRFARKHSINHRCWVLGQDAKAGNKYIKSANLKADELIALSDFIAEQLERNYQIRPTHIVPPGIEPALFPDLEFAKDIDILGAGSLLPLKQFDIFLEVIAAVKKQRPGVKAQIAGEGPERKKLEHLIINLGLEKNVTLVGKLSHPQVLQLMQRAKVFLHPSSYEGFGVVCIEALYARADTISFCQPMKEDIKNWHIVNSKEAMIQKATEILTRPLPNEAVLFHTAKKTAEKIMQLF